MLGTSLTDLCKNAIKRVTQNLGVNATIQAEELNTAINEYNLIADSWNTDGMMIPSMQFYTFPLTPGQQTYTIGPSANNPNFSTGTNPRPAFLEFASFQQTTSNPATDLPMAIVDADEWAAIVTKNLQTNIGIYVYLDSQWPLGNLSIWPLPSQSANIVLTTWYYLNSNQSSSSSISLPPGYVRALTLDLAISLAPYYGKSGSADVELMAGQLRQIKKDIGWVNLRGGRIQYSGEAQAAGRKGGNYDANSDQYL